jgi:cytochrome P450
LQEATSAVDSERSSSGYRRLAGLPRQIRGVSPFAGDIVPSRVPVFALGSGRPTLPFPHPWNYHDPIRVLESCFHGADLIEGSGRHSRYLDIPGFTPFLITRDPGLIRAIMLETGDRTGQFNRDVLPFVGIAQATGKNTLLSSNGPTWRRQRKLAATPFTRTKLFNVERFAEFEGTFRRTVTARMGALRERVAKSGEKSVRICLEPEIKCVMLEMLTNNFFGAQIPYDELRSVYVPALERVIEHIVRDTVLGQLGVLGRGLTVLRSNRKAFKADNAIFEELSARVTEGRRAGRGQWSQFKADEVPDEALRGNLRVFLAGALEATTSYACWAITHLARSVEDQQKLHEAVKDVHEYTPKNLRQAKYLGYVLDETLRLTPSLYFLPRQGTADLWVETTDSRRMFIPQGVHLLLDVWHANRHEDHWGVAKTGYPALRFTPQRWAEIDAREDVPKDLMHFGFGFGARICPGQHLGQLETALVVGAIVKLFTFSAPALDYKAKAGVSTKPMDGTLVELTMRANEER